jgi:hypothetical protein
VRGVLLRKGREAVEQVICHRVLLLSRNLHWLTANSDEPPRSSRNVQWRNFF